MIQIILKWMYESYSYASHLIKSIEMAHALNCEKSNYSGFYLEVEAIKWVLSF